MQYRRPERAQAVDITSSRRVPAISQVPRMTTRGMLKELSAQTFCFCLVLLVLFASTGGALNGGLSDYDKHALAGAAERGDLDAVQDLVSSGADINEKDAAGRTAVHHAARRGHVQILKQLLSKGADPNARTATGHTPLHEASASHQIEAARALLAAGADKHAKTSGGHSVLAFAGSEFRDHLGDELTHKDL